MQPSDPSFPINAAVADEEAKHRHDTDVADDFSAKERRTTMTSQRLWFGIIVAVTAGVFSALLQFAFVYGKEAVKEVIHLGYPYLSASAIIWTVATTTSNLVQLVIITAYLTRRRLWDRFFKASPLPRAAPSFDLCLLPSHRLPSVSLRDVQDGVLSFWKNSGRGLIMSGLLQTHIECYGVSQAFMGPLVSSPSWRSPFGATMRGCF